MKYIDDKKITDWIHGDGIYFPLPDQSVNSSIKTKSDYVNTIISENSQKYITSTDPFITRDVINKAKAARRTYTRAMKNLVKNGWDSFKKFEKHGVFDITGQTVKTDDKGNITSDGWLEMAQALRIYRDKHFETLRFAFINKTGTIQDQITTCSYMPNRVAVPQGEFLKDLIKYAEQTNTSIVMIHNHPSGNTDPSVQDMHVTDEFKKNLIDSNGKSLLQGHIILDHDTFGLYEVSSGEWKEVNSEVKGSDPLIKQRLPNFASQEIVSPEDLKEIAESINSNEKWNCKDWVPVLFVNSAKINSIRYYSKETLGGLENSEKIKEMFQTVGRTTGSIRAFLVVPDELSDDKDFLNAMKTHTTNGCFQDFYMDGKTTDDYGLTSHRQSIFEDVERDELRENTVFDTTFTPPSIGRKLENEMLQIADIAVPEKLYTVSDIRKGSITSDVDIFTDSYLEKNCFFPAMTLKDGKVHVYAKASDIKESHRPEDSKYAELVLTQKQMAVVMDYAIKKASLHKKLFAPKEQLASRDKMGKEYDAIIKRIKPETNQEERKAMYKTAFMNIEKELKNMRPVEKAQVKQRRKNNGVER